MEPYTKEQFDADIKSAMEKAFDSQLVAMDLIASLESNKIALILMLHSKGKEKGVF